MRLRSVVILLGCAVLLSGCGGAIGRLPGIGEPTAVPPPPAVQPEYPAVGASRERPTRPMTAEERAKLEAELAAARSGAAAKQRERINQPAGQ